MMGKDKFMDKLWINKSGIYRAEFTCTLQDPAACHRSHLAHNLGLIRVAFIHCKNITHHGLLQSTYAQWELGIP